MAPRPGGEADKVGNRYELAWAVRHAIYCMIYDGWSITAEDIDPDFNRGAEFTVARPGAVEVHQLKRQRGTENNWTVRSLAEMGIFSAAAGHIAAGREYHFVSLIPCRSLQELSDRARRAESLAAFTRSWLSSELAAVFDQVAAAGVLGDAVTAWATLRGMWFEVHDESDIVNVNRVLCEISFEGASGNLVSLAIGDLVLGSLGVCISRTELIEHLARQEIVRRQAGDRSALRDSIGVRTASWRDAARTGQLQPPLPRSEAHDLLAAIEAERVVLVSGAAGSGKSSVVEQAVSGLLAAGKEVLAFRLDRVEPFASTAALGSQLGFATSPAVALAIAAGEREAVLIVDQVDAVSLASGRMPQSFDSVIDLIREALAAPSLRVVLVCREFDIVNDYRIRDLSARPDLRTVRVGDLAEGQISSAVRAMGLDASVITPAQMSTLRIPLHLVLLGSISGQPNALSFESSNSLFSAFWERKRQAVRSRRDGVRFSETVARVADAASQRQTLSIPIEVLDEGDLLEDANILISEQVLARDGNRVAFFHEAFFDYAFARQWVSRDESLVAFLLADEQELFRRAQVRQILHHLRDREPGRFIRNLNELLTNDLIRFHIKETAIAVLGGVADPTGAEVDLALSLASSRPRWEERLWQQLRRPQWFRRFDEEGQIELWLASGTEGSRARGISFLTIAVGECPDRVAAILRHQRNSPDYGSWVRQVLQVADVHASREVFDLLAESVRDGEFDSNDQTLWHVAHDLAKTQPSWALELISARFIDPPNCMDLNAKGEINLLDVREWGASEMISDCAEAEPLAFAELVVPYLLRVMAATELSPIDDLPVRDKHFAFRFPDREPDVQDVDKALFHAAEKALGELCSTDPDAIRPLLVELAASRYDGAQFLLYRALIPGAHVFADWAKELMLQGTHRLTCGYISDRHWVARELARAIAPLVDDDGHEALESAFCDLRVPHERTSTYGLTAFIFLSALDEERLTAAGTRRLQEYQRKFGESSLVPPTGVFGGFIESPIDGGAADRMSDGQWLGAMAKHASNDHDWATFRGGAHELSSILKVHVAREPERFAHLALQLTPAYNPAYGDAILMGLGEAESISDPPAVFRAVEHIASWEVTQHDRWLGTAIQKVYRVTPNALVELLVRRSLESSDPKNDTSAVPRDNDERRAESIRLAGINTARGGLAEALGNVLIYDDDGSLTGIVAPYLDQLASDPSISVRSCVAHTIAAALRHDRSTAYRAFDRLIETDDILLATDLVQRLMLYIGNVNPEMIQPVVERMLASEEIETREAGGQLAAFAGLEWDVPELLLGAMTADPITRRGVARVCSARVARASNGRLVREALTALLNDHDPGVRKAAAECASVLRGQPLRPFADLLHVLIGSPAFRGAANQLLLAVEEAPDRIDDLVLESGQRLLSSMGTDAEGGRRGGFGDAHHLSELVVRGLAQSWDIAHRAALLDILDDLLMLGVYGVGEAIAQSERR